MLKKLTGLFAVITAGLFWAGTASAGTIDGSAHDFADGSTGWVSTGEICVVCHAPHDNASTTGLLWNRDATTATFLPYSNTATMSTAPGDPSGVSKLCLSCHDGTIAIDSFGGAAGTNKLISTDAAYVGTDLRDDHPISFVYPASNVDPEIVDSGTSVTLGQSFSTTILAGMLVGGKVECSSCHDVHNTNVPTGVDKLLLKSNANSALCTTCHKK